MIDGIEFEQFCCCKFLGVLVNDTLTWSDHVNLVCTYEGYPKPQPPLSSFLVPPPVSSSVYSTSNKIYTLPSFDYCDVAWYGCTKDGLRLETLVNYAWQTVLCKRKDYSASTTHKQLGLSTLTCRRKLHLALTMFKCLSSQSLQYLSQLFSAPSSHYNTHSSSSSQLNFPCTKTFPGQRLPTLPELHCGDLYQPALGQILTTRLFVSTAKTFSCD